MANGSDCDATGMAVSGMTMPVNDGGLLDEAWAEESVEAGTHKSLSRASSRSSWMLLSRSSSGVDLGLARRDEKEEEDGEGKEGQEATGVAVPASEPAKPTPAVSSGTFSDFLRSAPPPQVLAAASAAAADADGCDVCGDTHCYWEPLPLASELLCLAKELPRLCEKAHAHAGQALRPRLRSALQQLRQANTAAMWLAAAVGAATATLVSLVFESARLRSEVRALDVECRLLHLKCNMLLFR